MTCRELAAMLLRTPDANVKVAVEGCWHDVVGLAGTGRRSRRHEHDVSIAIGESDQQPDSPNPAELIEEQQSHYGELPLIDLTKVIKHSCGSFRGSRYEIVRR